MDIIDLNTLLATENLIILAIAVLTAAFVFIAGYFVYRRWTNKQEEEDYDKQFQDIFESEFGEDDTGEKEKLSLSAKWNKHWKERTKKAGIKRYHELGPNMPGRDAITFTLFGAGLIGLITFNIVFGIMAAVAIPIIYNMFLGLKISQIEHSLNSQVPSFLAAFKANIQANETPERALIRVIDDMGDPLYSELVPVKRRVQSGTDISDALDELKERTTSEELRFLCSCIKIAALSGADLEKQIDTIQGVIAERQKVADKLASAARSARPAMIMGTLIIPVMFFGIYMFYEQAREFWFVDPISYLALIAIIAIYGIGMWITKTMVDNLKKM